MSRIPGPIPVYMTGWRQRACWSPNLLPAHRPCGKIFLSATASSAVFLWVVEAASRSGTLITSRLALEQGREVYAVPGAALSGQSLGCQELVRQGAKPVFAPEDVLEDLAGPLRDFGVQADHLTREAAERRRRAEAEGTGLSRTLFACMPPETDTPPKADSGNGEERPTQGAGDTDTAAASPVQDTIIPLLREQGPLHVDALGAALGRSPAELAPVLLGLEIMGRIRRLPGARYEAV